MTLLPSGAITVGKPIILSDCDGRTISGQINSRIVYVGPPTAGVIQLQRANRCVVKDLEIVVASEGVEAGLLLTNLPAGGPITGRISSGNLISNVRVLHGGKPTAARRGFSVDSYVTGGIDNNNDLHQFIDCYAQSYSEAGFYVRGTQCHQLLFDRCAAHDAGSRRPIGWYFQEGVFFRSVNCTATNNSTDFKLGSAAMQSVIDGFNSELSNQFIVQQTGGAETFLNVSNVRWDGAPIDGKPVVDCFGPGPYTFTNCFFAGTNGVCPTLKLANYWNNPIEKRAVGSVDLRGVNLRQHGGSIPELLIDYPKTFESSIFGCSHTYLDVDGSRKRTPIEEVAK